LFAEAIDCFIAAYNHNGALFVWRKTIVHPGVLKHSYNEP
jgi:hypothetical protein